MGGWQEFYEGHYQDVREDQLKRIYPEPPRYRKKLDTTVQREAREARYTRRSNICSTCHMTRPCECE